MSIDAEHHPLPPTLGLNKEVRDAISTRIIPIDYPAASWPATHPYIVSASLASADSDILTYLRGEPGWVLVDTGFANRDDCELISAAWNLFSSLCRPVPQYRTGELVYFVEVANKLAQASSHYSQSNKSGGFHTDGTLLDMTPDIAMLAGISTADEGGETVLIDGHAVVARLAELSSQSVSSLEDFHPFHSGDESDPVVAHRVIDRSTQSPVIRYMRRYIELGYIKRQGAVSDCLTAALQDLDALTGDPRHQTAVLIKRGYLLLWNNQRCLHGRRPFKELRERRRLLRTYGMESPFQPSSGLRDEAK